MKNQKTMNNYTVFALDVDECELRTDDDFTNKKTAIKRAREFLNDSDLSHELYKVEVRDNNGEVEWDMFVL